MEKFAADFMIVQILVQNSHQVWCKHPCQTSRTRQCRRSPWQPRLVFMRVRYHDRRTLPPGTGLVFYLFKFKFDLNSHPDLSRLSEWSEEKGTGRSYYGHKNIYVRNHRIATVVWASKANCLASFFWNYMYPIASFLAWGVPILPRSLPSQHISPVVEMTIGNTGCSSPDGINNWLLNPVVGGV